MAMTAIDLITNAKGRELSADELAELSVQLASELQLLSGDLQTPMEKRQREKIVRMIGDPMGKPFVTAFADSCFRSKSTARTANQIAFLLEEMGTPHFLRARDRAAMRLFHRVGPKFHARIVPFARRMLRREMRHVIGPGERDLLARHIQKRRGEGVDINLNRLGEQILGKEEARRRREQYLADLERPEIETISVKISSICDQINHVAHEATLERLKTALRPLYRTALERGKFVNLDMEEARDLDLTLELFCSCLEEPEFHTLSAGIVLQAYLPESLPTLQTLTKWALDRVDRGGARIKVRIVKGANLAMEQVESSLMGWPQAPYRSKLESDASFKEMTEWALRKEHIRAIRIGIASHNLFDVAYALLLRASRDVEEGVTFEMLEGMAPGTSRAVKKVAGDLLLYSPVAEERQFEVAIAYLIRRLDEQTASENFLRHSFHLEVGGPQWQEQADSFTSACRYTPCHKRRRRENRLETPKPLPKGAPFQNEPDTDWSLPQHAKWAKQILKRAESLRGSNIPLMIDGKESGHEFDHGIDPSFPDRHLYTHAVGDWGEIEQALESTKAFENEWGFTSIEERATLFSKVAEEFRKARGSLIGAMVTDTAKIIAEGDKEVSEAIDFILYYSRSMQELGALEGVQWSPKGTILVASPWNFPCAIPTGGIASALAAGNCVLFKPAPEAILVGWMLVQLFWKAGVPKQALQFLVCPDDPVGSQLVSDPRLNAVILTGATATAHHLLSLRPGLDLYAETGGKNSLILSDLSDHDLAIGDLIQSAFGHAGQKCSAASLGILMEPLYNSPDFLERLRDAAESLITGSPWDLSSEFPPLILPPKGALLRGLTTLDPGEEWLLEPRPSTENPHLWTPGIKIGVAPGSFTHQTELFGPVLGLMSASNLEEACQMANATPYGLTSGIHSLDPREVQRWQQQIVAGNLYINRTITGAIVERQPFGGTKASSFGTGLKTGGPNYLTQLQTHQTTAPPSQEAPIPYRLQPLEQWIDSPEFEAALKSYAYFEERLSQSRDRQKLLGQDNLFRCTAHRYTLIRLKSDDKPFDIARACAAALIARTHLEVSWDPADPPSLLDSWPVGISISLETEEECALRIRRLSIDRIRTLGPPSSLLLQAAALAGSDLCSASPSSHGRIELLHYMREVSTSHDYHRYGNLGLREEEPRSDPK